MDCDDPTALADGTASRLSLVRLTRTTHCGGAALDKAGNYSAPLSHTFVSIPIAGGRDGSSRSKNRRRRSLPGGFLPERRSVDSGLLCDGQLRHRYSVRGCPSHGSGCFRCRSADVPKRAGQCHVDTYTGQCGRPPTTDATPLRHSVLSQWPFVTRGTGGRHTLKVLRPMTDGVEVADSPTTSKMGFVRMCSPLCSPRELGDGDVLCAADDMDDCAPGGRRA